MVYVGIASVPAEWLAREWNYVARLVVVGGALAWAWPRLLPLKGPRSTLASIASGIGAGVIGCAAWVALLAPWASGADAWSLGAWSLRMAAAVLLVPVFEEQLMRGYFLRLGTQWQAEKSFDKAFEECSVHDLPAGKMSALGVALSTALFTVGHAVIEWPAAIVYALLMCALYRVRRDMISVMAAHATTNLALALYVWRTGDWGLWG